MLSLPVAAGNAIGIAVVSLAFIVAGYLLLVGLWYLMVYRPSRQERRASDERSTRRVEGGDQPEDGHRAGSPDQRADQDEG